MNLNNLTTQERLIYNALMLIDHNSIWGNTIKNVMNNDLTYDRFKQLLGEMKDQAIDNKETIIDIIGESLTKQILAHTTFKPVLFCRKNVDPKKKTGSKIFVEMGRLYVDNQGGIEYCPSQVPFYQTLDKTVPLSFIYNPDTQQWYVASDTTNGFSFQKKMTPPLAYVDTIFPVADAMIEHHFKGLRLSNKTYVFSIIDNPTHENGLNWYPIIFKREI